MLRPNRQVGLIVPQAQASAQLRHISWERRFEVKRFLGYGVQKSQLPGVKRLAEDSPMGASTINNIPDQRHTLKSHVNPNLMRSPAVQGTKDQAANTSCARLTRRARGRV